MKKFFVLIIDWFIIQLYEIETNYKDVSISFICSCVDKRYRVVEAYLRKKDFDPSTPHICVNWCLNITLKNDDKKLLEILMDCPKINPNLFVINCPEHHILYLSYKSKHPEIYKYVIGHDRIIIDDRAIKVAGFMDQKLYSDLKKMKHMNYQQKMKYLSGESEYSGAIEMGLFE